MYSSIKRVQILVSLLKEYGIKTCVLSPGSRNVPFVHSVETDPFFSCYSVVDERSAAYFALGLSQKLQEPVVISCTAATAPENYYPAITEAFYQGVPLVVLTFDHDPSRCGHWEDQMTNLPGMYDRYVRRSISLPFINIPDDEISCVRMVNETLLELDHHGKGPVHINIPMRQYNTSFECAKLPEITKIDRIEVEDSDEIWNEKFIQLKNTERIMLIIGQNSFVSDSLTKLLNDFSNRFNVAMVGEYMANARVNDFINMSLCLNPQLISDATFNKLLPEIVLTIGGNVYSGIKQNLNHFARKFEHWSIQPDGRVVDTFRSINNVFECSPEFFFEKALRFAGEMSNNQNYVSILKSYKNSIKLPEVEYSHLWVIRELIKRIPDKANLHLSVNDAIRIANYFDLSKNVNVYANIGAVGIDGPLSTFIGQSVAEFIPSYLIIGDLAFFYDMNALRINSIKNNIHILLINNQGGSEFYYNHSWIDENSDKHTTARHNTKAEGWVKENGFKYFSACDKKSFMESIDAFCEESSSPTFFEIFTDMKRDAEILHNLFDINRNLDFNTKAKQIGKNILKSTIGTDNSKKIAKKIGIFNVNLPDN